MSAYTVSIVGRPNVGKSTLFNRLVEERKAIVDDTSGVTRDRHYGEVNWNGKEFSLIDTGGFLATDDEDFNKEIRQQVILSLDEANAIIFMVDVYTGITQPDIDLAAKLRKTKKPVFLVVNKVDNFERSLEASEFYSLGFDQIFFLSSTGGTGTGELLDAVVSIMSEDETTDKIDEESLPKIAIVGQPNVGKSSLLNALLGEERTIVSDISGTTRDSIHTHYKMFQKDLILIDTAGIRRKAKVNEDLEYYSVIRAIKAIDKADVCLIMLDAQHDITAQDLSIFGMCEKKGKGVVVLVNKWDLVEEKSTNLAKQITEKLQKKLAPFNDVPILFISVKDKQRIFKVLETALAVYDCLKQKISTSVINDILLPIIAAHPAPVVRGNIIKIKYITQLPTRSPAFAFFCNFPNDVKAPYKNFLENQLRKNFNFTGVPIKIFLRKK